MLMAGDRPDAGAPSILDAFSYRKWTSTRTATANREHHRHTPPPPAEHHLKNRAGSGCRSGDPPIRDAAD